uniref:Uncharacterized protein n=1 Tax=Arundo donax TaxID=35708 RepID=A0A0A9PWW6_ARUDO
MIVHKMYPMRFPCPAGR